jgi:hypothetical protein
LIFLHRTDGIRANLFDLKNKSIDFFAAFTLVHLVSGEGRSTFCDRSAAPGPDGGVPEVP